MVRFYGACGRGECEHVINSCCNFKGAFVTVSFYAVDPFRIQNPRSNNACHLVLKRSDYWALWAGVVIVINWPRLTLKAGDSCCCTTFKLIIIITVQQIMLTIILILDDCLNLSQTFFKARSISGTSTALTVCIAAPFKVGLTKICLGVPNSLINQSLQACAICAGLSTVNSGARTIGLCRIDIIGFIQCKNSASSTVH